MEEDIQFALPPACSQNDVISTLQNQYLTKQDASHNQHYVYYDTFDWRLYNQSLVLCQTEDTLVLQSVDTHGVVDRAVMISPPVFVSDFPSSTLKDSIAPLLHVRALLELFAMHTRRTRVRILNRDTKTVVHLLFEADTLAHTRGALPFATCVWLKPVRGYDKYAKRLATWLTAQGCTRSPVNTYLLGLEAVNKQPGEYSSKIRPRLRPAMCADAATKTILRGLLHVIHRNEAGVKQDIDTEFLHDFRVAVRRTRAALGQLKAVFPADATARFKKDFAFLTTITNQVRDLDVYLLHHEHYQALLPAHVRPDIEPLFTYLQWQRAKAFRTQERELNSKKYTNILRHWEVFLEQPPASASLAPNASRPIVEVACKRIEKKCRGVVTLGARLLAAPDEQMLHALRLECKKLRYLLEFFSSLFPGKNTSVLINHLKTLQDNLGRLHDLCVQQEVLHQYATKISASDPRAGKTVRAIDSLIGFLDGEKQTVNQAFPEMFTTFAAGVAHNHSHPTPMHRRQRLPGAGSNL